MRLRATIGQQYRSARSQAVRLGVHSPAQSRSRCGLGGDEGGVQTLAPSSVRGPDGADVYEYSISAPPPSKLFAPGNGPMSSVSRCRRPSTGIASGSRPSTSVRDGGRFGGRTKAVTLTSSVSAPPPSRPLRGIQQGGSASHVPAPHAHSLFGAPEGRSGAPPPKPLPDQPRGLRASPIVDTLAASTVVIRVQGLPEMVVGGAHPAPPSIR